MQLDFNTEIQKIREKTKAHAENGMHFTLHPTFLAVPSKMRPARCAKLPNDRSLKGPIAICQGIEGRWAYLTF